MQDKINELLAAINAHKDDHDWPVKETQMLSRERVNAIQKGDHEKIAAMDAKLVEDFGPLYAAIDEHGDKAFNQIKDRHGKPIAFCGNKNAMMWVRITEDADAKAKAPPADKDKFVFAPKVEVGTMSKAGGKSVWTTSWWKENIPDVGLGLLALGIGHMIGKSILGALTRRAEYAMEVAAAGALRAEAHAALEAAHRAGEEKGIHAAIRGLKEANKVVNKVWMKNMPKGPWVEKFLGVVIKVPKITAFLGGAVVTIAFQLAFEMILLPLVVKDYFIKMEVLNFDEKHDWKIHEDWYHDNGIIAGGSAFDGRLISRATHDVETPWGPEAGEFLNVQGVTYFFQNSFVLMNGVGVALKAQRADEKAGKCCAMAYFCSYFQTNQLTVKGEFPSSSAEFYGDKSKWPVDETLLVEDVIHTPEGLLPIKAHTNALNKAKDNIYTFVVGIGKPYEGA